MSVYLPAAAASGNLTVAVRLNPAGQLEWSHWNLGAAGTMGSAACDGDDRTN
jgi:hypothetical protein